MSERDLEGRTVIITGAGGGFGRLIAQRAAAIGAAVTGCDVDEAGLAETVASIEESGGTARGVTADVTSIADMRTVADAAMELGGSIDVLINNAGVMPIALFADHERAIDAWHRAVDINIKGVVNGIAAVHDQMRAQGRGHVINISSIYGNHPTYGGGVYAATKAAVNFLSESLRIEAAGVIKVTTIRPTHVVGTNLGSGVINREAGIGGVGHKAPLFLRDLEARRDGTIDPAKLDPDSPTQTFLQPDAIADAVLFAMTQPDGVSMGDMTVRASGDHWVI